jgi:predicted nucleic acid-binding protein
MSQVIIIDTGFLVALLNRTEQSHTWVKTQLSNISSPLLTCEPVITETCFLLQKIYQGEDTILNLIDRGKIQIPFRLDEESSTIRDLMQRYQSVPMSLADACLVRMAEIYPNSILLTLDSDFRIYRKNKNQMISLIIPDFQ